MSEIKKFFIHYSHFFTGQTIATLFGFISFPVFTRILTQGEYGIMSLVATTIALLVALTKGGLSGGIVRYYAEYNTSQEQRDIFSSTIFFRGLIIACIAVLLYLLVLQFPPTLLGLNEEIVSYFMIMAVYVFIRPMNIIVLNLLQTSGKTILFNIVTILERGAPVFFSILLLLYVIGQFAGYFGGLVLGELTVSLVLFIWFFSTYKVNIKKVSYKLSLDLISFGLPLLLSEILYLLLSYLDRYLIFALKGEDALGVYSVGHNMAFYVSNILMVSLTSTIIPLYTSTYQNEGREKTEAFLSKAVHYMLILLIPTWFGYCALAEDIFIDFTSEKYASAAAFSPIILLGSFCFGMNSIFSAGLFLQKKTKQISAILCAGFVVNILTNLLLIPKYGVLGSAFASLLGYVVVMILTIIFSNRHIAITVSFTHILYYLGLSGGMFFILSQIEMESHWFNLIVKVVCGAAIITLGALYKEKEVLERLKEKML